MKITRTQMNHFAACWQSGHYEGQRYGQAWYNHFKLHSHNPDAENRVRLDQIYNERNENIARVTIFNYYVDESN